MMNSTDGLPLAIILLVIGVPVLLLLCFVGFLWWLGNFLGKKLAGMRIEEAGSALDGGTPIMTASEVPQRWAEENGFHFVGYYRETDFGSYIAAWKYAERPTFFCHYLIPNQEKPGYDFVTVFADDIGLTTSSSDGGQLFPPRRGSYKQSFSSVSLDGLWGRHLESEEFLMDEGGAELVPQDVKFKEAFADSMRKQTEALYAMRLWQLRLWWWYFTRRKQWHELLIPEQYERGMIRLPKEMG
jgi:hypothetical protein